MSRQFMLRFVGMHQGEQLAQNIILPNGDFYIGRTGSTRPFFRVDATYVEQDQLHLVINETGCTVRWAIHSSIIFSPVDRGRTIRRGGFTAFEEGDVIQIRDAEDPTNQYVEFQLNVLDALTETDAIQVMQSDLATTANPAAVRLPMLPPFSVLFLQYLPEIFQPHEPLYEKAEEWAINEWAELLQHTTQAKHPNSQIRISSDTFLSRYLGIFESVFLPLSWTVDNFCLFLSPMTAPDSFLPWLEQWFALSSDLNAMRRRRLLRVAIYLKAWQGTKRGLRLFVRLLTGKRCQIIEGRDDRLLEQLNETLKTHEFLIYFPGGSDGIDKSTLTQLVDAYKPVQTCFRIL